MIGLLFFQENCAEVILGSDAPFKRLDHYKLHEYTRKWNISNKEPVSMTMTTSIDTMFKRKRGRPPKNRVVEVSNLSDLAGKQSQIELSANKWRKKKKKEREKIECTKN